MAEFLQPFGELGMRLGHKTVRSAEILVFALIRGGSIERTIYVAPIDKYRVEI
jgi:hypothetical protein